jgi:hypothetical protein
MLGVFEFLFGVAFPYTVPRSEENAAIEHILILMANSVISSLMISMVNKVVFLVTVIWWSVLIVLDLVLLCGDFIHQIGPRISSCCMPQPLSPPSQERSLVDTVESIDKELETIRSKYKILVDASKDTDLMLEECELKKKRKLLADEETENKRRGEAEKQQE